MSDFIPLKDIPNSLVEFNRERYRNELAQGIYDLMVHSGITRTKLADLLGVQKSRVSHLLSGSRNLQADTLADVLLVMGRTPHLVLSTDFDEIRFPVDEGNFAAACSEDDDGKGADMMTIAQQTGTTNEREEIRTQWTGASQNIAGRIGFRASNSQDSRVAL